MGILEIAKAGATVYNLSKEDICDLLIHIDLTAAAEAVRKSYIANDQKAAVYSAINHLEGAESIIRQKLNTGKNINLLGIEFMSIDAAFRAHEIRYKFFELFYIYACMATLYYKIGEKKLTAYCAKRLMETITLWNKFNSDVEWTPGHYLNPKNWRYLNKRLPISADDLELFINIARKWNISDEDAKEAWNN